MKIKDKRKAEAEGRRKPFALAQLKHIDLNKLQKTKQGRYVLSFGEGFNAGTCVITCPDPTNEADRFWFELRLVNTYGRGVQAQVYLGKDLQHLDDLISAICRSADSAMQNEMQEWTFLGSVPPPPEALGTLDQLTEWVNSQPIS